MNILKVKIEGDECMSSNITWAQKIPKTINLRETWVQANANIYIFLNSHPSFNKFWFISSETNAGYTIW